MVSKFLGKFLGGEKKKEEELNSCCGAVSVTEEVEATEPVNEPQASTPEPTLARAEQRS